MAATHIFCSDCGSKNDFANGRRPNFCSGCGYNFNSLAAFGGNSPAPARPQPSRSGMDIEIDNSPNSGRGGRNDNYQQAEADDAGFSKDDVQIEGVPVKIVAGGGNTTRVIDTTRPTVGSFFAHPVPPEEARHPINAKATKRLSGKKALETFKAEAGFGGVKRTEIGGE